MAKPVTVSQLAAGPEEAGRMTGHTRSAIYTAIARGELKSFKSGKRRLILISELERWINCLAAGQRDEQTQQA